MNKTKKNEMKTQSQMKSAALLILGLGALTTAPAAKAEPIQALEPIVKSCMAMDDEFDRVRCFENSYSYLIKTVPPENRPALQNIAYSCQQIQWEWSFRANCFKNASKSLLAGDPPQKTIPKMCTKPDSFYDKKQSFPYFYEKLCYNAATSSGNVPSLSIINKACAQSDDLSAVKCYRAAFGVKNPKPQRNGTYKDGDDDQM